MLGLRRKRSAPQAAGSTITADLSGARIEGQVAVGENINQFYAERGAIVNYIAPEEQPRPRLRQLPIARLPRDFAGLLGREEQVEGVADALASGLTVEIVGEVGIGKSALLRYLSRRSGQRPSDGTVYHACAGEPLGDLLQFVFESFYECDTVFVPTPAQLTGYLQERGALLILDDLGLARDELQRLMDTAPSCLFLTASTSRQLWGEGRTIELPGLGEEAAVALLERELGRPLSEGEGEAARSVWRSVNGHPLRVLQAAALMRRASGQRVEVGARGVDAVSSSLAGSLSDTDQRVLKPLAALPAGSLHADDVAAVTGVADAAERLRSLEADAVVQSHSPRYSLAGTLGDQLIDESERVRWRERLLDYFAGRGEAGDPGAAEDAPTMLALLRWGEEAKRWRDLLRLARRLDKAFALGGRWAAWRIELEAALTAARALEDRAAEAWALHQLGSRALCLGEMASAEASLGAALELREALGDQEGAAITRHNLELISGPGPPAANGKRAPWKSWPALLVAAVLVAAGVGAAALLANNSGTSSPSGEAAPGPTTPAAGGQDGAAPPPQGALPNLRVSSIGGVKAGPPCEVVYTLSNSGAAEAGSSVTEVTVVDDERSSQRTGDEASPVPSGAAPSESVTFPSGCPLPVTVTAVADAGKRVSESNEDDNAIQQTVSPTETTTEPTTTPTTEPTTTPTSETPAPSRKAPAPTPPTESTTTPIPPG
jgi:hypothetical protein